MPNSHQITWMRYKVKCRVKVATKWTLFEFRWIDVRKRNGVDLILNSNDNDMLILFLGLLMKLWWISDLHRQLYTTTSEHRYYYIYDSITLTVFTYVHKKHYFKFFFGTFDSWFQLDFFFHTLILTMSLVNAPKIQILLYDIDILDILLNTLQQQFWDCFHTRFFGNFDPRNKSIRFCLIWTMHKINKYL